jgi:tRNA pseudouridine55 synthase
MAIPARPMPGLYLVHKPVGVTSHAVVRDWLPRAEAFGLKLCHAGTLDPFAEGLLVLLVGPATRLMEPLHDAPKSYVAEVVWGRETDTGDAGGRATGLSGPLPDPAACEAALTTMLGWREQVPPATSAKKLDGEPAYRKAHRGETVVLPPSRVYLHEAAWLSHREGRSTLALTCRGGFYVRALARDLGRALGSGGHLCALRRTAHGPWQDPGPHGLTHVVGADVLPWLPTLTLDDASLKALRRDGRVAPIDAVPPRWRAPDAHGRAFPYTVDRAVAVYGDDPGALRGAGPPPQNSGNAVRAMAVLRRTPDGWTREIDLLRGL